MEEKETDELIVEINLFEFQENKTNKKNRFFFIRESFNLWCLFLMIVFYHQTKTPIGFGKSRD